MPGRKPLRRIQFGREITPGTAVAATARMRFPGDMLSDDRVLELPPEAVGIIGGTDRSVFTAIDASLSTGETPMTPEQLPYLLAMLYGGPTTGTADGTGSTGFRYATTVPTTSVPANTAYTVEGGDDYEQERMEYSKVIKLTLKGAQKGQCSMQADLIGRQVSRLTGGFAVTTLVDTNDLVFAGTQLFLDAVGGTIGTTQITNQFLGYEITFEAMWIKKYTGDNNGLFWQFVVFTDKKITGKLTLEHDPASDGGTSGATGLKTLWRANTPRLMRINNIGQAYATPGTGTLFTGGRRGVRIDLPIRVTKIPPLADLEGNDTVTVEFESRYNNTAATAGTITVCNEVSALP